MLPSISYGSRVHDFCDPLYMLLIIILLGLKSSVRETGIFCSKNRKVPITFSNEEISSIIPCNRTYSFKYSKMLVTNLVFFSFFFFYGVSKLVNLSYKRVKGILWPQIALKRHRPLETAICRR